MAWRLSSLVVWLLVAASTVFWGFKLFVRAPAAPAQTQLAGAPPAAQVDLTRLLGAEVVPVVTDAAPPPLADARFQLVGVVAPRAGAHGGVALIAVDGKPARAYRVGSVIDGETVLQAVQSRGASLGQRGAPASMALTLPPLPVAATGTLPAAGAAPRVQPTLPAGVRPVPMMSGGALPMPSPPPSPVVQAPDAAAAEADASAATVPTQPRVRRHGAPDPAQLR